MISSSKIVNTLKTSKIIAFITPCKSSNPVGLKIDPRELQNDIDRDAIEAMKWRGMLCMDCEVLFEME